MFSNISYISLNLPLLVYSGDHLFALGASSDFDLCHFVVLQFDQKQRELKWGTINKD